MGNCFTSNKTVTHNDQDEAQSCCNEANEVAVSNMEGPVEVAHGVKIKKNNMKKKKMKKVVRFKLNEEKSDDDGTGKQQGETKNGVVRIRLVVTQEELKQIVLSSGKDLKQIVLSSGKDLKQSSMEQLVRAVKLRGVRVSEDGRTSVDDDGDGCFHGGWRPALESIPEEH